MSSLDDYKMMTDEEIIDGGVSEADSGRITELVSRYSDTIALLVKGYDKQLDHNELISEAYSALLRAIVTYKQGEDTRFSTYAGRCIRNSLNNAVDKAGRDKKKFVDISDEEFVLIPDTSPSMEELMVLREQADDVSYHIAHSLTELEKRCINGVVLGMGYDDIARQLDIDRKSVDNAVTRARAKLKKLCGE